MFPGNTVVALTGSAGLFASGCPPADAWGFEGWHAVLQPELRTGGGFRRPIVRGECEALSACVQSPLAGAGSSSHRGRSGAIEIGPASLRFLRRFALCAPGIDQRKDESARVFRALASARCASLSRPCFRPRHWAACACKAGQRFAFDQANLQFP